jgi:hypothetical protein
MIMPLAEQVKGERVVTITFKVELQKNHLAGKTILNSAWTTRYDTLESEGINGGTNL